MRLRDGTVVRTWKNPVGVEHIFLGDCNNKIIYGGFVGWIHSKDLQQALTHIIKRFYIREQLLVARGQKKLSRKTATEQTL